MELPHMGRNYCFILSVTLSATKILAYPVPVDVDGNLHAWNITSDNPTVYFDVNVTDEALETLMTPVASASAVLWTDVDKSLITLAPASTDHPAQITVNYTTSIAGGDTAAGYSIFDSVEEGVPKHCSIHIAANNNTDFENLHKTTLHELGHCLGLGHSLVADSIMSYHLEANSFALSLDDEAAISRLYPVDGSSPKLPPGCSIGKGATERPQPTVLAVLLLIPLVLRSGLVILRTLVRI